MKAAKMSATGTGGRYRRMHIPQEIADQIDDDTTFVPELTEEGLLFRVVYAPERKPTGPGWLRSGRKPIRPAKSRRRRVVKA